MPLQSFHRVMDLPPEIRHEIYFLATPDRVVHIRRSYPTSDLDYRKGRFSCSTLIHPLLHMCSESWDFLTRTGYKLVFWDLSTGRRFWFNFERDTLFLDIGGTDLAKYLSELYEKWGSLDHLREYLESSFAKYWAELGRPSGKLPKFKPVHLLTDAEHQHIQRERRIGFRMLQTRFRINRRFGLTKNNHVRLIGKF
ncbi:hypothetical protein QWA68_005089 [Fusarium oxysporum]|nr:hypothetical protein QWA68_005089 [Fusarium oxysporum]